MSITKREHILILTVSEDVDTFAGEDELKGLYVKMRKEAEDVLVAEGYKPFGEVNLYIADQPNLNYEEIKVRAEVRGRKTDD